MSRFTNQLRITEIFHSIQGESVSVGLPTVFVRLTGCPLRCQYCDTDYAFQGGKMITIETIVDQIKQYHCKRICITGGEPLAQPGSLLLMRTLCDQGFAVSIETSGARPIQDIDDRVMIVMDIKTPDSKECDKNLWGNLDFIKPTDQIKFVLCSRADYQWTCDMITKYRLAKLTQVLLSPSWGSLIQQILLIGSLKTNLTLGFNYNYINYYGMMPLGINSWEILYAMVRTSTCQYSPIKYMGKSDEETNLPANPSLSYTLDKLQTFVVLEHQQGNHDFWEPLNIPGAHPFMLPVEAQKRYLNHLQRVKEFFDFNGSFVVRSTNNFPHSSGLASSASAFAALTKCAAIAISELQQIELPDVETLANLSRQGSGSSCRSFFAPWALWDGDKVSAIDIPYKNLIHQVVIVSNAIKSVPSSEAHKRIRTSPEYSERVNRAKDNLKALIDALTSMDWHSVYQICWQEFQDMHHLFATAQQPFSYMSDETSQALQALQDIWQQQEDGPVITMDAGPNIHLLYRPDQVQLAREIRTDVLLGNFDVI